MTVACSSCLQSFSDHRHRCQVNPEAGSSSKDFPGIIRAGADGQYGVLRHPDKDCNASCDWLAGIISMFLIQKIAYHFWVIDIGTAAISYIFAVKDQNILCNCYKGVGIGVWTAIAVSTSSARAKDTLP